MTGFKVLTEEVHQFQLEDYIFRPTPCVVLEPKTPSYFTVRVCSKGVEKLRKQFEQDIAGIYNEFLNNEPSDDTEICDMQEYFSEANEAMNINGSTAAVIFDYIKEILGDYGVVHLRHQFHRVLIVRWCEEKQLCFVFLIDEGSFEYVSAIEILPLSYRLKKYPYFSITCHLHRVAPPEDDADWSVFSKEFFQRSLKSKNCWLLNIFPPIENVPTTPVQLFWVGSSKAESVTDELVRFSAAAVKLTDDFAIRKNSDAENSSNVFEDENKLDVLNTTTVKNSPIGSEGNTKLDINTTAVVSSKFTELDDHVSSNDNEELDFWDPREADFESNRNRYDIDVDNPGVAIFGYAGKDDSIICAQFGKEGFCYKGDSCRKQHIKMDPNKVTNLPQLIYTKATMELPNIYINHTYQVHCFCIDAMNVNVVLVEDVDIYNTFLKAMTMKLNNNSNVAKMKPLAIPPGLGELVAFQLPGGLWTRARCINSDPDLDEYQLKLVDLGSSVNARQKELRTLEFDYLQVPFMSREVLLHGVKITSKPENIEALFDEMKGSKWSITVVDHSDCPVVVMKTNNINLSDVLVYKGFAVKFDRLVANPDSLCRPG